MSTPGTRLDIFKAWFIEHGGSIHPDVSLRYSDARGVHMQALKPLKPGTRVISCPHALTISSLNGNGIALDAGLSKSTLRSFDRKIELPRRDARSQCQAAFFLCVQYLLSSNSFWAPYLDVLPLPPTHGLSAGRETVDTPLWWPDDEKRWLLGTAVESGVSGLESLWRSDWNENHERVKSWLENNGLDETRLTFDLFKQALTVFGSRAFAASLLQLVTTKHNPDSLLYPGIDMLNHSATTANHWFYDSTHVGIVCNDCPQPGDEILNSYGAKTNSQLLLSWGFIIPENPHDSFAIRLNAPQLNQHLLPPPLSPSSVYPDKRPLAADIEHRTYYIRHILRHKIAEYGYPSTPIHLRGIPSSLLVHFAATLANSREKRNPNEPQALRNTIAVTHLLVARFKFDLQRLQSTGITADPPSNGLTSHRAQQASLYRAGQISILEGNIALLEEFLETSLQRRDLISLDIATTWLGEEDQSVTDEFSDGLEKALESKDMAALEEAGWANEMWALWVGFAACAAQHGRTLERAVTKWREWYEGDEGGVSEEAVESVMALVKDACGGDGENDASIWKRGFSEARVRWAVRVVEEEVLQLSGDARAVLFIPRD